MFDAVGISVFLATAKPEECLAFYTDILGLPCREDNKYALVFDLKGVELRISKVPSFTPHMFTVLEWQVPDIAAAMMELLGKGLSFKIYDGFGQDNAGVWAAPDGTKIAWFTDPDDNVLSVSQRA